jgi:hypothetical protein
MNAKQLAESLTVQGMTEGAETMLVAVCRDGQWYVCFSGGSMAATGLAHEASAVMHRVNQRNMDPLD